MSKSSSEFSGEEQEIHTEPIQGAPTSAPETEQGQEALPPEAQGDANGGPLGCCLGMTVGILLSLCIGIVSRFYPDLLINVFGNHLSEGTRILMAVVGIGGAILFGYLGWRIGKRFYREYELSPRQKRKLAQLEARQARIDQRRRRAR